VVLTSFADGGTFSFGTIVRFPRIVTVYGISNKSAFKNSGKFVCELAGFYLFSVHILTKSNDAAYQIQIQIQIQNCIVIKQYSL